MDEITAAILRMIEKHDGEWSWYQLGRALGYFGFPTDNMMASLRWLKDQGLVKWIPESGHPQPRYFITETGRKSLREAG